MRIILFFILTGLMNFAAGFALATMLDHGPRSWREVRSWLSERRTAVKNA
ncbi:hypothetical protein [Thermopirellula anaerolimosa]